ncbi:MAG: hypothetical protein ACK5AZ_05300 [Bryobacteraceae bacterium]
MDLYKAIRDLYEEKQRIETAIASLEAMLEGKDLIEVKKQPKKRRGRKTMTREEREAVSERMRKYWEKRRASEKGQTDAAGGG